MPKTYLARPAFPLTIAFVFVTCLSIAQNTGADSLCNPFTLENTGLPYVPRMCGVGMPERLEEKYVREAVETAFSQAGIQLKPGYLWQGPAGAMYLDGYDSVSRCGYVFLDAYELGEGTAQPYAMRYGYRADERSPLEVDLAFEKARLFYPSEKLAARERLTALSPGTPPQRRSEYEALVEAVERGDSTNVDSRVVENFYLATYYLQGTNLPAPLRTHIQALTDETRIRKRRVLLRQLYLLSQYGLLLYYPAQWEWRPYYDRLSARAIQLVHQKPGKKRDVRLDMLRTVTQMMPIANYATEWKLFLPAIRSALDAPDAVFWDEIASVSTELEYRRASIDEIENMHQDASRGRAFIVVLSHLDAHTILRTVCRDLPKPPDSIRNDMKHLAEWERRQWESRRALDQEYSMQYLEQEIQGFICWTQTRSQKK